MLATDQLAAVAALWGRTGRELTVRFSGRSMEPTLASDEEVLLRCGVPVALGDIIAFLAGDHVIVHRVVARSNGWILTRGDARTLPDAPILRHESVLGRVAAVRRGDALVEPPVAPPDSRLRGLVVGLSRAVLELSPPAGAGLLAVLVAGRRALLNVVGLVRGLLGSTGRGVAG